MTCGLGVGLASVAGGSAAVGAAPPAGVADDGAGDTVSASAHRATSHVAKTTWQIAIRTNAARRAADDSTLFEMPRAPARDPWAPCRRSRARGCRGARAPLQRGARNRSSIDRAALG